MSVRKNPLAVGKSTALTLFGAVATAAGVLAFSAASALATPYLSADFQPPGDTAGSPPAGVSATQIPSGGSLLIVDSATSPVDPFGGTGNQSLWMRTPDSEDTISTRATFEGTGPGLTSGTFSGQFYIPSGSGYSEIRIGTGDTFNTDIGIFIALSSTGAIKAYGTGNGTFDNTLSADSIHTLTIDFDAAAGTFTGTLDGNPLTLSAQTTFNFFQPVSNVSSIGLTVGFGTASDQIFYDNLSLAAVPEPASLGLLGLLATGLLCRRRR